MEYGQPSSQHYSQNHSNVQIYFKIFDEMCIFSHFIQTKKKHNVLQQPIRTLDTKCENQSENRTQNRLEI